MDQSGSQMDTPAHAPGQLRGSPDLAPIQQDPAVIEQEAKPDGLAERRGLKSLPALESVPTFDLNNIPSTPVRILTDQPPNSKHKAVLSPLNGPQQPIFTGPLPTLNATNAAAKVVLAPVHQPDLKNIRGPSSPKDVAAELLKTGPGPLKINPL